MKEQEKPTVLLEYHLKKLKLPTMLHEYAAMAKVCTDDRCDFMTYLLRLTERELLDREKRAAERRIKQAAFPERWSPKIGYLTDYLRADSHYFALI